MFELKTTKTKQSQKKINEQKLNNLRTRIQM